MIPARYPAATWRPVSYAHNADQIINPMGWIPHVVVGNGSPWSGFEHAPKDNQRFSHLWVSKAGLVEQYQDLRLMAWAAVWGNPRWWHVECEGYPSEPYTDAQLDALAAVHVFLGAADAIADTPLQRGIGTHAMGGSAWGGHTCPDPAPGLPGPRSRQRGEILRRAALLREDAMPLSDADVDRIALRTRDMLLASTYGTDAAGKPFTLAMLFGEVRVNLLRLVGALPKP